MELVLGAASIHGSQIGLFLICGIGREKLKAVTYIGKTCYQNLLNTVVYFDAMI